MYNIYALIDPRDLVIKYVGSTRCLPRDRLSNHLHAARMIPESRLGLWLNSLQTLGLRPRIEVLTRAETREPEGLWIRYLASDDLLNINERAGS